MVHCIDDYIAPNKAVRSLIYTDAAELTGDRIATANAGYLYCAVGSIAMKAGFTDMKQLDANGTWVSVG